MKQNLKTCPFTIEKKDFKKIKNFFFKNSKKSFFLPLATSLFKQTCFTSKGSYRSWKKIVKVWMMMMKKGIFAGHSSIALPLPPPRLDCPCLTCPCPQPARHPPPPLTFALLTLAS